MNVIEDYVFRRRRHIDRRIDPKRDRHEHRNRQHKKSIRRRRRREVKISWHRSEVIDGRRRLEAKHGIAEDQYRAVNVNDFRGRGWRHVINNWLE